MFRTVRRLLIGTGSVAVVATATVISYRNANLYYQARLLERDRVALENQLQSTTLEHDAALEEAMRRVSDECMKRDGVERLWADRFRRYATGLEVFQAAEEYFPSLVKKVEETVALLRDVAQRLKVSDEYEFASSKIHMLALLLHPSSWLHSNFTANDSAQRVTWQATLEQSLTRSLYRGDPLVQIICASYDVTDANLFASVTSKKEALTHPEATEMMNILNRELNAILRSMREVLPLTIKTNHPSRGGKEELRLRDISLIGMYAEETIRRLLRLTKYVAPLEHSAEDGTDISAAFALSSTSPITTMRNIHLRTLEHVVEAIGQMERLLADDPSLARVMPAEFQRAQNWVAAAESMVVREMGFSALKSFHTCLTQSMVLRK